MKALWFLYFGIIPLCLVESDVSIIYLDEHCGTTVHVGSDIRLQASKDSHLRLDYKCEVKLDATAGNSARIHARFLSIGIKTSSECKNAKIELYEGTSTLTPANGLCGDFLYKTYSYSTVNQSIMTFAFTPISHDDSFDAIITPFHEVEGDEECLYKWWKCENGRCVDPSTRCNTFDNCGDSSDETYETCNTTTYLYEHCGQEIHVDDFALLKLMRNEGYLIPDRTCDNIVVTHGKFPDLGEVVDVYAHFRSISLSPPDADDGVCKSARIDIYSGLRNKENLTESKGLCGSSIEIKDYSTKEDNFMPIEFNTGSMEQHGHFEIILTSFHTGDCLSGEFRCDNGWCVDSTVTCNGFQNCADNSDESDQLCIEPKPSKEEDTSMSGGEIALLCCFLVSLTFNIIPLIYLCIRRLKCKLNNSGERQVLLKKKNMGESTSSEPSTSSGSTAQVRTDNQK